MIIIIITIIMIIIIITFHGDGFADVPDGVSGVERRALIYVCTYIYIYIYVYIVLAQIRWETVDQT